MQHLQNQLKTSGSGSVQVKGSWKEQFSAVVSAPTWQHVRMLTVVTTPGLTHEQPWVENTASYLTEMHLPEGSGEGLSTILMCSTDGTVPPVRSHA